MAVALSSKDGISYQCSVTATDTPVMAELDPAIRSDRSLRQMADWVAGSDEWVSINEKWYYRLG